MTSKVLGSYLWEEIQDRESENDVSGGTTNRTGVVINTKCRLCGILQGHTLHHYVSQCPAVGAFMYAFDNKTLELKGREPRKHMDSVDYYNANWH